MCARQAENAPSGNLRLHETAKKAIKSPLYMGQQLKTVAKRRRRAAYLERKKAAAKKAAAVAAKAKK